MKIHEKINKEFKNWINATSERQSNKCFIELLKCLEIATYSYIQNNYTKLVQFSKDIFQEISIKVYLAKHEINAQDYFSAWFYKSLKNLILNEIAHLNTDKISNIKYDYEFSDELAFEDIEGNNCYNEYLIENQNNIDYEVIYGLLENDKEYKLLNDKFILGYSNKKLAEKYNTSIDGINSRVSRAKKRIKDRYNESIELS